MAIKCVTYGGRIGWFLRKHFSRYTSAAYLKWQYGRRKKLFLDFIDYAEDVQSKGDALLPSTIAMETINRCNSTCEFCPANKNTDKRPFQKMDEALFKKLIGELRDLDYDGYLTLYVNNEPFMDTRIIEWHKYAKEQIPRVKTLMYTNGLLLTLDKFKEAIPYVDKMIINNYSTELKLHKNLKEILDYVNSHDEYKEVDVTIQIRYIKEILTNRGGVAPNKQEKKDHHMACVMPYTDFVVFPDGRVGICCNDALEQTNLGNVTDHTIHEIWNSDMYKNLRKKIGRDRTGYPYCASCDFMDAGIRNELMLEEMQHGR